jgi:hypothetical protein
MVVARKSTVSTRGNWFRRDSILSLGRRRSAPMESAAGSASTPVSSSRQQRSSKNLAVSPTNKAVIAKSVKELDRQQLPLNEQLNANQKSPEEGFLGLPTMPNSGAAPLWLLRLYTFHRYSSVVAFLLVASTLAVYGWTVYSQELWGSVISETAKPPTSRTAANDNQRDAEK